jgi:hypothetical protein
MPLVSDDRPRWPLYLLGVIVTIGAILRLWQVGESLWIDELHTAWCASGSLAEVAQRAAAGNQSPLFFWLEWLLTRLLGHSELVLRLPSLVAGTLLPVSLFLVARHWTRSAGVALVAAALAAVDASSIFYSTEARPYGLVELLTVIHVAIFVELLATPTPRLRIAFVSIAALLFHLHYTAALLLPAELAFWLLARRIDSAAARYRPTQLVLDLFFLAALMAPAVGNVLAIAERRDNWARFVANPPPLAMLDKFFWGLAIVFILADPDTFLRSAWPTWRQPAPRQSLRLELPLLATVLWFFVPLAIAWVATTTDLARLFFARYLLVSAPAAMLVAALCTRLPRRPAARQLLCITVVGLAILISGIIPQWRRDGRVIDDRREDWRSAIRWLDARHIDQPLLVLVAPALIEADELRQPHAALLEDYCLYPVTTAIYPLHIDRANLLPLPYHKAGQLDRVTSQRVIERRGAWLVIRGSTRSAKAVVNDAVTALRSQQDGKSNAWQIAEQRSFGNIHIIRLVATSDL